MFNLKRLTVPYLEKLAKEFNITFKSSDKKPDKIRKIKNAGIPEDRLEKQFKKYLARYEESKKKPTPGKAKSSQQSSSPVKRIDLLEIQSNIQKIFSKLDNVEYRLRTLEKKKPVSEKVERLGKISDDHFFRILKSAYSSSEKRFGDFVSVSALTDKIKEFIPWTTKKIHSELYKLFMDYKIDLQPGKYVEGTPLIQDGKTFVWFKLK